MEVWTLINKNTNKIIRCDLLSFDVEFGNLYYFTDEIYSPLWFVDSYQKVELAFSKEVHDQFANNYDRPKSDYVNLDQYQIIKFETNI